MSVTAFKWMANDIYQVYVPSLNLSSYGPSSEAATEMMNFSLKDFVLDLEKVGKVNIELALSKLGWNRDSSGDVVFSHINIDKDDVIQQLELKNIELIEERFSINC